ncbi:MAG: KpsF/GutQ family sugar-phosphate isomerase [Burkholderiaceae bacterium]|jgi:arabinose-5-phosphate isomerase|nr:KpsF/GutQ family sugar-phosphate isomerase [Burkholderiales bacterium]MCZ8101181.1 KpsF/GutQ family sugar-phosphate isomerase [Burkholderiales bacterium]MCZ8341209.1 KpsF/GutQ family sugar-phosphate isomerase [Burkholderiaceae bacterium]
MTDPIVATPADVARLVEQAREVLRIEADAVASLVPRIGTEFAAACGLILACRGRVVVSGMGKSGHVARKLAATLASTGTPAFFVHPAEASHGDLGMVTRDDVFIALSNSGRTEELLAIVVPVKRQGAKLVAITGDATSPLAREADVHLDARVDKEACPLNLAPTASTTAALALGDALAVALLDARGFDANDFARSHPGGSLGRRLLTRVADVMRTGDALPSVAAGAPLPVAILEVTRKRMGMTAVIAPDGRLAGVFTDGDLRRLLERTTDVGVLAVDDVMSRTPATIAPESLAVEAVRRMEERRINQLVVVDAQRRMVGALHIHDLLAARVV